MYVSAEPIDATGAIPAATVILSRDSAAGIEILVIERAKGMGFAGGAVAFPGGKVDAGDHLSDAATLSGFDALERDEAAGRITAAREAFEEAGVLLSAGPPVSVEERALLRPLSDRHELDFADLLARIGHRLDAAALTPFARWLPPVGLHTRFDTRFYLAVLPDGEHHLADGHEAVASRWARPADLLAELAAGSISLLFPTRCNIARLAQFSTVAALMADTTPPPFIQPQIAGQRLSIPEGVGYPYTSEDLTRTRRE